MIVQVKFQSRNGFMQTEIFANVERVSIQDLFTEIYYGNEKTSTLSTQNIFRIFVDGEKVYENLGD